MEVEREKVDCTKPKPQEVIWHGDVFDREPLAWEAEYCRWLMSEILHGRSCDAQDRPVRRNSEKGKQGKPRKPLAKAAEKDAGQG